MAASVMQFFLCNSPAVIADLSNFHVDHPHHQIQKQHQISITLLSFSMRNEPNTEYPPKMEATDTRHFAWTVIGPRLIASQMPAWHPAKPFSKWMHNVFPSRNSDNEGSNKTQFDETFVYTSQACAMKKGMGKTRPETSLGSNAS